MNFEQLPPETILHHLEARLQQLEELLIELQKLTNRLPSGRLRISQKSKHVEFYHVKINNNKLGTYIPRNKLKLATQLAQKDYNARLIKLIHKEINALQNYLRQTENCRALQKLYASLNSVRQTLVTPITLPDAQYIQKWQKVEWKGRPFAEDEPDLFTTNGERVRSKSEVEIADALNSFGIPYRYEYPLTLKNGITVYPDFLCLNVRTRQEFYWEHFGKLDSPSYAENVTLKLRQYNVSNIFPGKNLIITVETSTKPLNRKHIENQIKTFLT